MEQIKRKIKRFFWNLKWEFSTKPLGAKIKIKKFKFSKKDLGIRGYYKPIPFFNHIGLTAKEGSSLELIVDILNHEILHGVLAERINYKTSKALDKIHIYNGRTLEFRMQGKNKD